MHDYGSSVSNILQCHKDGYMHLLLAWLHEVELISGILIKPSLSHLENVGVARRVNTAEGHILFILSILDKAACRHRPCDHREELIEVRVTR